MAEASSGEALEGLAEALYLEREYAEAAAHYERAYAAYRWERRSMAAGRAARAVAWITGNVLGDWAVQSGWIARAGTILEEVGTDGPERGWVLILRSYAPGRRPRCCWPAGATRSWSWTGRRSQRHRLDPSAAPAGRGLAAPLGLLERLTATGCPPIGTYAFDFGPFTISGAPGTDDTPVAYGPRRTVLDKLLVDAAADAGAEVREGFTVQEVVVSDGRVTGIRGHGRDGGTVTEQARVVVGADGRHSAVARAVAPEQYHERPPLLCGYYSYWSGLPMGGRFETWVRPERGFAAWPTHDDLTLVIGGWPYAELEANRDDIEGNFLAMLEMAPAFAERVRAAKREERFVGTAVASYFRRPYGPGWALVGDAGYNRDFITAQGMHEAFRDAELCAAALDEAFSGVHGNQGAMDAFARMMAGVTSPAELLSEQNVGRILANA